ncbi:MULTISPECIES: hypothetical protein [Ruminococcus]|uniref:Lipoprotein n=1 Tax=Ruminococcus flavefaciens TaxID=1265 RepID=A0A1M7KCR0_RUMFL|nr:MULTISPECIES: hypothetical protein [Ruminococcus]MCR4795524.1 hypothetical protein [Ruminococcus sp.]SHM63032.1 hypothetical protein SAMN04487860_10847 [Ruminococcus flavefaciens]
MNRFITSAAALTLAASIAFSAVSCGSKKDEHDHHDHNMVGVNVPDDVDISSDELGYGATQKDEKPEDSDVPIGVSYDPRYMTHDEAVKVVDYFYSLSARDASRLENAVYPPVLKYDLEHFEIASSQEFLNSLYDMYKEDLQTDFEFTYVLVEDILENEDKNAECAVFDEILKKAAPDANVTDKKLFKVNCTYKKAGGHGSLLLYKNEQDDATVAVYTIDGVPYIIS